MSGNKSDRRSFSSFLRSIFQKTNTSKVNGGSKVSPKVKSGRKKKEEEDQIQQQIDNKDRVEFGIEETSKLPRFERAKPPPNRRRPKSLAPSSTKRIAPKNNAMQTQNSVQILSVCPESGEEEDRNSENITDKKVPPSQLSMDILKEAMRKRSNTIKDGDSSPKLSHEEQQTDEQQTDEQQTDKQQGKLTSESDSIALVNKDKSGNSKSKSEPNLFSQEEQELEVGKQKVRSFWHLGKINPSRLKSEENKQEKEIEIRPKVKKVLDRSHSMANPKQRRRSTSNSSSSSPLEDKRINSQRKFSEPFSSYRHFIEAAHKSLPPLGEIVTN